MVFKKLNIAVLTAAASFLFLPSGPQMTSEARKAPANIDLLNDEIGASEADQGYWVCKSCSSVEQKVLRALQDHGIRDKVALAVIMGNIKQESRFNTTICEGGKRTGYHSCHSGGFGLIQWTTAGRYNGLGQAAAQHRLDPNSLDAQLKWLFAEREWQNVENRFKTEGMSFDYYMNAAYRWLGWGVHGSRTMYSKDYISNLSLQ